MSTSSKHFIFITALYWIVSIVLFNEHGVKNVNDSHRYLEYAANLRNGFYIDQHNFWYIGYAIFTFVIHSISKSDLAIVIAQYLLSYIAVLSIYKTSTFIFSDANKALACSLFYICFIEIISWNSYILCESVYLSLTCISFYLLSLWHLRSRNVFMLILTALVVLLTMFSKPTGIALLGALSAVVLHSLWTKLKHTYLKVGAIFISSVIFILLANKMLATYLIMENYQIGEIIYAISTLPGKPEYTSMIITPPHDLYIPSEKYSPVIRIIIFIANNPVYWVKLFCMKLFYFFSHVRPYWSVKHNLFCLFMLIPIYFYFFRGLVQNVLSNKLAIFTVTYVVLHALSVGITSVDWDGRFLMPVLPILFLLGTNGLVTDIEKAGMRLKKLYAVESNN